MRRLDPHTHIARCQIRPTLRFSNTHKIISWEIAGYSTCLACTLACTSLAQSVLSHHFPPISTCFPNPWWRVEATSNSNSIAQEHKIRKKHVKVLYSRCAEAPQLRGILPSFVSQGSNKLTTDLQLPMILYQIARRPRHFTAFNDQCANYSKSITVDCWLILKADVHPSFNVLI